jgi:soluble lytic murein transglycosylase-like protein
MRYLAATLACLALALPTASMAADAKARKKLFERQSAILDKRNSQRASAPVRLAPTEVHIPGVPSSEPIVKYSGAHRSQFESAARKAARRHNVPEDLFLRLVTQESAWNPSARSHKGAIGLAQLMPGTALYLRVNPHDPVQNLEGGARYLAEQYRKFRSWRLALAAYNAGPAAVEKHNGIPPYRETQGYVRAIMGS